MLILVLGFLTGIYSGEGVTRDYMPVVQRIHAFGSQTPIVYDYSNNVNERSQNFNYWNRNNRTQISLDEETIVNLQAIRQTCLNSLTGYSPKKRTDPSLSQRLMDCIASTDPSLTQQELSFIMQDQNDSYAIKNLYSRGQFEYSRQDIQRQSKEQALKNEQRISRIKIGNKYQIERDNDNIFWDRYYTTTYRVNGAIDNNVGFTYQPRGGTIYNNRANPEQDNSDDETDSY